jgi:hypothetical protein
MAESAGGLDSIIMFDWLPLTFIDFELVEVAFSTS